MENTNGWFLNQVLAANWVIPVFILVFYNLFALMKQKMKKTKPMTRILLSGLCTLVIVGIVGFELTDQATRVQEMEKKSIQAEKDASDQTYNAVEATKPAKANVKSNSNVESRSESKAETFKAGASTFKDSRDGQTYRVVKIGSQIWMGENLNYKAKGGFCYDNSESNCSVAGRLYNWSAAQKVCPAGWRLPTNDDFETLKETVENECGSGNAGACLKSVTFKPTDGASKGINKFGFDAIAGGDKVASKFTFLGENAYFWSSTEEDESRAYDWVLTAGSDDFVQGNVEYAFKKNGFSVRCIRK